MVQLNPVPVFGDKKNTTTTWRKFFTGISVQMVSALECLTICICHNVDSTLSSFILGPFVLVRPGFEPEASRLADRLLSNWANQAAML